MDYWIKFRDFKNGNSVLFEKTYSLYVVKVYLGKTLHDKIICDTYDMARMYFKAFAAIAKNN